MKNFTDIKVEIKQEIFLKNGYKVIVYRSSSLSDLTEIKKYENVVCFESAGEMIWKINGMDDYKYWKADAFVGVGQYEDGTLVATDWDGFVFEVNKETGKAIFLKWVK